MSDIFAPPSEEELADDSADVFAPPTPEELGPEEPEGPFGKYQPIVDKLSKPVLPELARAFVDGSLPIGSSIPVLGPLAEKAGHAVAASFSTPEDGNFEDQYDKLEHEHDERKADYAAEHPWATVLSSAAGGSMLPVPGNVLTAPATAGKAARAATAVGNAAIRTGANTGLEAADAFVRGNDVASTAEQTAAINGGMELLGLGANAAGEVGQQLKKAGARKSWKAMNGNNAKLMDQAEREGRLERIGQAGIDDGVVKFGSNARSIQDRAGKQMDDAWSGVEGLFSEIDAAGNFVSGQAIANDIAEYAAKIDAPNNEALVENLMRQAARFEQMGDMPLAEAQRLKNLYAFDTRNPAHMSMGAEATNAIKGTIGRQMEAGVERFGARAGQKSADIAAPAFAEELRTGNGTVSSTSTDGPVLREAEALPDDAAQKMAVYKQLKQKYGDMAMAEEASTTLANRQEKNQSFGPTDKGAGALGFMKWGPKGVALGYANKLVRERGNSAAAVTLSTLGDKLKAAPQRFGRYAPQLQAAAARGNHALAVTHFLLSQQDENYRRMIEEQE